MNNGIVGSNPTLSARRFNVVKSHHWLVASSSWQRGFPQHVDVTNKNLYETVAGFDLATLYEYIDEDLNQRIEEKAHSLVKQLASFRNKLKT